MKKLLLIMLTVLLMVGMTACQPRMIIGPSVDLRPNEPGNPETSSSISEEEAKAVAVNAINSLDQSKIKDQVVEAAKHFMGVEGSLNNPQLDHGDILINDTIVTKDTIIDEVMSIAMTPALAVLLNGAQVVPVEGTASSNVIFKNYDAGFQNKPTAENGVLIDTIISGELSAEANLSYAWLDKMPEGGITSYWPMTDNLLGQSTLYLYGTYNVSSPEPIMLLMADESASRYDVSFDEFTGVFIASVDVDWNSLEVADFVGSTTNYSKILDVISNPTIRVYLPSKDANYNIKVSDPSTGDFATVKWSEVAASLDSSTNFADSLGDIESDLASLSKLVSYLSGFGTVRFFNNLDSALENNGSSKLEYGDFTITNYNAIDSSNPSFEIQLRDYVYTTSRNTATGIIRVNFDGGSDGSYYTVTEYNITGTDLILSDSYDGATVNLNNFAVTGSEDSGKVKFTVAEGSITGIDKANGEDRDSLSGFFDDVVYESITIDDNPIDLDALGV